MLFIFQLICALSLCSTTSAGYLRAQELAVTPPDYRSGRHLVAPNGDNEDDVEVERQSAARKAARQEKAKLARTEKEQLVEETREQAARKVARAVKREAREALKLEQEARKTAKQEALEQEGGQEEYETVAEREKRVAKREAAAAARKELKGQEARKAVEPKTEEEARREALLTAWKQENARKVERVKKATEDGQVQREQDAKEEQLKIVKYWLKKTSEGQMALEMFYAVNAYRESEGLERVCLNVPLTAAALKHSDDQKNHERKSHFGSNGSKDAERVVSSGYDYSFVSPRSSLFENVTPARSAKMAMAMFHRSEGHDENLLERDAVVVGLGVAEVALDGYRYWTQVFGGNEDEMDNCIYP